MVARGDAAFSLFSEGEDEVLLKDGLVEVAAEREWKGGWLS